MKEQSDIITLDLFNNERHVGRPKTNLLPRQNQLKINKRNQIKRDKAKGLKRVELKLSTDIVNMLDNLAEDRGISRAELIEILLLEQLHNIKPANR